jgi:hypothetical protein
LPATNPNPIHAAPLLRQTPALTPGTMSKKLRRPTPGGI